METDVQKHYIIDFDGTFTKVEALEILAEISLAAHPDRDQLLKVVKNLTRRGMEGEMDLKESIRERISIIKANRSDLIPLIDRLRKEVSKSFHRNEIFFQEQKDHIYIISNGFKEFIVPIVTEYGIKDDHVLANTFEFDDDGAISGLDESNPLSANGGKAAVIKQLNLEGEISRGQDTKSTLHSKVVQGVHRCFRWGRARLARKTRVRRGSCECSWFTSSALNCSQSSSPRSTSLEYPYHRP